MTICVGGCSQNKTEYESVALTETNYKSYLAINIEFSDYSLTKLEESYKEGAYYYTASVIVHISTSSKKSDIKFGEVQIQYACPISTIWETNQKVISPTATLDSNGNSKCSYVAISEHQLVSVLSPSIFLSTKNIVSSIEGYVLVPKE